MTAGAGAAGGGAAADGAAGAVGAGVGSGVAVDAAAEVPLGAALDAVGERRRRGRYRRSRIGALHRRGAAAGFLRRFDLGRLGACVAGRFGGCGFAAVIAR